ncbi:hypothetical protein [Nonomuraea insulae]|uniref:Uncharacterized protein n=1 Tax=Nonomuraea insulae TaxID=1616787 RepID=A0ABW1CD60_9ACTN
MTDVIENLSMDVPELLRRAAALVPAHVRSDVGMSAQDVLEYLGHDEWEVALGVLEDFDGIHWQPVEYWTFLADAAQQMWLKHDAAWCHWRATETRNGLLLRADLQLISPEAGGRRLPIPGAGQLRPMWGIGSPDLPDGLADLHVGFVWVESAREVPPGGQGHLRLCPLSPANWRHLSPGDQITMHEQKPVGGIATITEIQIRESFAT